MAYGTVFAGLMLLWPLLGLLGTLGFAPLLGLTGLAALVHARPRLPPAPYALLAIAFILWAAASEFWSPTARTLVTGSLTNGDFAIGARSIIVLLTALFAILTLAAALRSDLSPRSRRWIYGAFAAQAVLILATAVLVGPALSAIYGDDPVDYVNGIQNIGRNLNTFALVAPILAGALAIRGGRTGLIAASGIVMLVVFAALRTDNQTALFAVMGMLTGFLIVSFLPKTGYRWLFSAIAAYIAAAPFLVSNFLRLMTGFDSLLPASFRSRFWSWEVVMSRIGEAPLTGHGLGATRTWRETFAEYPAWLAQLPPDWADYPAVPGHPHNMALQIWAETGLIGALLAAFAVATLAFRLPRPEALRPEIRFAVAGIAGGAISIFSFAYSVWNEAFWSGLALIVASLILLNRSGRGTA